MESGQIDKENLLQYVSPKDIKSFGLIPEIIGRLPVLSHMNPLDKTSLLSILTEPKNAIIKQYQKLFAIDNITLEVTPDALELLVDKALEHDLGARGLRSLCEAVLTDAMYELPSEDSIKELKVDKTYVKEKLSRASAVALGNLKAAS
jgi:ATP-dependent Clp protease ATP-binding subunit ClpX